MPILLIVGLSYKRLGSSERYMKLVRKLPNSIEIGPYGLFFVPFPIEAGVLFFVRRCVLRIPELRSRGSEAAVGKSKFLDGTPSTTKLGEPPGSTPGFDHHQISFLKKQLRTCVIKAMRGYGSSAGSAGGGFHGLVSGSGR